MISTLNNFFNTEKRYRNNFTMIILVIAEVLYTIIGPIIGFIRFDEFGGDIPFAKQHVLTIILLVIASSASFWLARLAGKVHNPWIRIITSIGLLQGIVLCAFTAVHFIEFIPNGIIYPTLGFELLSPLIVLILLCRELYLYNAFQYNLEELLPYRQELGFIPLPLKIVTAPFFNRTVIYGALLIPLVIAQILFAYACGQDLDAIIKAFTHSHGFIFSN
jgi:hypothetical protein